MDDKLFEDKPFEQEFDDSLFEDKPIEAQASAPVEDKFPKISQGTAAEVGLASATNFGMAPITRGAGEAVIEAGSDIKDLITGSQEPDDFPAKDNSVLGYLESLRDAYYSGRDKQKALETAAFDQHPGTYMATNVGVGIPMAVMTGGLGTAANVAGNSGKAAQALDAFNKLSTTGKAVTMGAGAGGLAGFGSGDAKLLEGEFAKTAEETGNSALGGAVLAGAASKVPAAAGYVKNKAGEVVDHVFPNIKTGFKLGQAGVELSEEGINKANLELSEELMKKIQKTFRDQGMDAKDAKDLADQVGVRVNAGEAFESVMESLNSPSLTSVSENMKAPLRQSVDEIMLTPTGIARRAEEELNSKLSGKAAKAQNSLDMKRASQIQKMEQKGAELLEEAPVRSDYVQDIVPDSESQDKLLSTVQAFDVPSKKLADGTPTFKKVEKLLQQTQKFFPEAVVDESGLASVDIQDMKLSDVDKVIAALENHTGDYMGKPNEVQKIAQKLVGSLRELRDQALTEAGEGNESIKNLHKMFQATERAKLPASINSKLNFDQNVDALRRMTNSSGQSGSIDRGRFFEYAKSVDPEFGRFEKAGDVLRAGNQIMGVVEDATTNLSPKSPGFLGKATAKIGHTAGTASKNISKWVDAPVEQIDRLAQKLGMPGTPPALQTYAAPLLKASQAPTQRQRTAIMWGLTQQPAFREYAEGMGDDMADTLNTVGQEPEDNIK